MDLQSSSIAKLKPVTRARNARVDYDSLAMEWLLARANRSTGVLSFKYYELSGVLIYSRGVKEAAAY